MTEKVMEHGRVKGGKLLFMEKKIFFFGINIGSSFDSKLINTRYDGFEKMKEKLKELTQKTSVFCST